LFSLLTLVDPSMQCGSDLGRYGRWDDRGNDQPAQGEIEQSASTFRSQSKVSPHDARTAAQSTGPPPIANHQGWLLARAKRAKLSVAGDRGISSRREATDDETTDRA
jgi:hypothetical protein